VANTNTLQREVTRHHTSRSGLILANFVQCIHTNCYFAASHKNSEITIRFSYPNFLKESNNNLAIRRRFHAVTLTFDIWPWTLGVMPVQLCAKLKEIQQSTSELLKI